MNMNEILKMIRICHGISSKKFSEMIDVSYCYVNSTENRNLTPSMKMLEAYSRVFKIPVSVMYIIYERCIGNADIKSYRDKMCVVLDTIREYERGKQKE